MDRNNSPSNRHENSVPGTDSAREDAPAQHELSRFEADPVTEALDPNHYPAAVSALRLVIAAAADLDSQLSAEARDMAVLDFVEGSRRAWSGHPLLAMNLSDVTDQFGKCADSIAMNLMNDLLTAQSLPETLANLAALASLDRHDRIVTDFLAPALEKREGFPNIDANHDFAVSFLRSLEPPDFAKVMHLLDLNRLSQDKELTNLVTGLIEARGPGEIVDFLAGRIGPLQERLTPAELRQRNNLERATLLALKVIETKAPDMLKDTLVPRLERLYTSSAARPAFLKPISNLLIKYNTAAARRIVEDTLQSEPETNVGREARFYAVGHLAHAVTPAQVTTTLTSLLATERDPYVASHAAYLLAEQAKKPGREALTKLICGQIKGGELSYALATLISLSQLGKKYDEIFIAVMQKSAPTDFEEQLRSLTSGTFSQAGSNAKVGYTFTLDLVPGTTLPAELFLSLGTRVVSWARPDTPNGNLKQNSGTLLDYACRYPSEKLMTALVHIARDEDHTEEAVLIEAAAGLRTHLARADNNPKSSRKS